MRRFKSPGQAQRFLASFDLIRQHFHLKHTYFQKSEYRQLMRQRFETWHELTGSPVVV